MRTTLGIAFLVVVVGWLSADRARAQQACGYGMVCVYTVPAGAPPAAVVAQPVALAAPQLAASEMAAPTHRRPRWGLLITGLGLFAGGYGLSLAMDDADGDIGWSLLPLAGPFLAASDTSNGFLMPFFIVGGLLQIAGTVMTIVGAAAQVEVPSEPPAVMVTPYASADSGGLAVAGRF